MSAAPPPHPTEAKEGRKRHSGTAPASEDADWELVSRMSLSHESNPLPRPNGSEGGVLATAVVSR
eukprot:CAMPEP_0114133260 /NCGR_PEP_ID=MMETSP0043_2-20121206/13532_1 /TAXON_ID=464988 /ORGANISM="Hemiselmis andersenii, Strain CCMP644" /LENGTH=64 /DNA_ID=CAMNT_0001226827 /DNA_START=196 /DNA_END=390 /DNA_ORIENTATION=-